MSPNLLRYCVNTQDAYTLTGKKYNATLQPHYMMWMVPYKITASLAP